MRFFSVALFMFACALARAASFEVLNVLEPVAEANPVTRTRVLSDKTEFSFVAPEQWQASADGAARRFTLQCSTNQIAFTIKLLTNAIPASPEKLGEMLTSNFTEVTGLETYRAACGSGPGVGADFRHRVSEKFVMNTRTAIFPAPEGSAEVTLSSPNLTIEQLQPIWGVFIGTFKVEPRPAPKK